METLEKIAKVKELLPRLKDPARIEKAKQFLAAHGEEQRTGFIGSGTGNQQEGLAGLEEQLPEKVTATMPEHPSMLESVVAPVVGAAAVGLDNGLFAGIPHRIAAADIPSPISSPEGEAVGERINSRVAHGLASRDGESTADTEARIASENPLVSGAGGVASLLFGGLPALIDRGLANVMERVGLKAAPSAILKQAGLGAARGVGTALASGAAEDTGEAVDNALRDKPVDMSTEGEKMVIRALLGGGLGAIGGGLGARAAANLDPSTSAGAGGTAQQIARIRRLGGDIGLAGIEVPPSVKPLYEEAMAGGTQITPKIGGLAHENQELPGSFSPGSHVEDVAAERALGPVQKGIAAVDAGNAQKFQAIDSDFYNSSARHQRFEPKEVTKTLQRYIKARTYKDGSPVPYANSGEPIKELNKLYSVGSPISGMDKKADALAHPGSFTMRLEDARAMGFNVPAAPQNPVTHVPGPEQEAFVVITPKMVSPEQFEQAMAGINNAAKAAEVRGSPDALHAELQQAGFKDRREIQWPAEVPWPKGVSRQVHLTLPGDRGSTTLTGWAAIQAQKAEKLGNLERDLFFMGTTPAEATNETTGTRAILNSLKTIGSPGASRAERSLSKFAVNQPGGRQALEDMESINAIEGSSGLRKKMAAEGVNPISAHNRKAMGLRLDPAMRAAGKIFPRAGAATPLDDRDVIKALLQSYGIGAP